MTAPGNPVPAYVPGSGHMHKHGTNEPGWIEHSHLGGGASHAHDPETGMQVAHECCQWTGNTKYCSAACDCGCHDKRSAPGNPVPAEAIAAAVAAWHEANRAARMPTTASGFEDRFVSKLLAAAAPHITAADGVTLRGAEIHRALDMARAEGAADERERCRQIFRDYTDPIHLALRTAAGLLAATPGDSPKSGAGQAATTTGAEATAGNPAGDER